MEGAPETTAGPLLHLKISLKKFISHISIFWIIWRKNPHVARKWFRCNSTACMNMLMKSQSLGIELGYYTAGWSNSATEVWGRHDSPPSPKERKKTERDHCTRWFIRMVTFIFTSTPLNPNKSESCVMEQENHHKFTKEKWEMSVICNDNVKLWNTS